MSEAAAPGPSDGAPRGLKPRGWPVSLLLSALVTGSTLLTLALAGAGVLWVRLPQLEAENKARVAREATAAAELQQRALRALQGRVELLAAALARSPDAPDAPDAHALLDAALADEPGLSGVFVLDPAGRVQAAGLPPSARARRAAMLAMDMSGLSPVAEPSPTAAAAWGRQYVSLLSAEAGIGLVVRVDAQRRLLAELPLRSLLRLSSPAALTERAPTEAISVWLVDARGEVLVDTARGAAVHRVNLHGSPLLQRLAPAQAGAPVAPGVSRHSFDGDDYHVSVVAGAAPGWTYIARTPAGLAHPRLRTTMLLVGGAFLTALFMGLALTPLLARRLTAAVGDLVRHAQRLRSGAESSAWPLGPVREFNQFAAVLDGTTEALRRREREFEVIFNATPVAMAVSLFGDKPTMVAANDAWCRQFGYRREEVLGRPATDLQIWSDTGDRDRAYTQALAGEVDFDAFLRRRDGSLLLCHLSGRLFTHGDRRYMVWGNEDITERRRIERALR